MPTLSNRDCEVLVQRGITARNDHYEVQITFNSKGVAWLFNYLYASNKIGAALSLSLLKDIASFQPTGGSWRELKSKAVPIPAYDRDDDYFLLLFYLNGSPPRAFHAFPPDRSISNTMSVPIAEGGTFKVRNDQIVNIEFTDAEVARLRSGGLITVEGGT